MRVDKNNQAENKPVMPTQVKAYSSYAMPFYIFVLKMSAFDE